MHTHSAVPVVETVDSQRGDIRVYYCSRDTQGRSQIGFFEVNLNSPEKINYITEAPILTHGELGAFDDNGVTATEIVKKNDERFLYYVGWNRGVNVRMHLFAGLAISKNNSFDFKRVHEAPILPRSKYDPYLTATLSVEKQDDLWRMWYVSGERWELRKDGTYPYYNIKQADSIDGINWNRSGQIAINFLHSGEHAIARPCVRKIGNRYHMWFCHKGENYQIGYATSLNGFNWERKQDFQFPKGDPGDFDSEMTAYPYVICHQDSLYLFYNGNEYGKSGIGMAKTSLSSL